jgi:hypothetical protein
MATYYVDANSGNDSNNGSSNQPWKKLSKALSTVQPGDEVRIRTGVYHEELPINVANTTWKADTGHKPVLDGRYHEGLFENGKLPFPEPGNGYLPEGQGNMVRCREDGITLDGLTIQNCAGTGIGCSASNVTIRNCRLDFTYDSSIKINPTTFYIDNVVVENNVCTRSSMRYFDPNRENPNGSQSVNGVCKIGRTRDGIIRNNVFAFGHGEGINVDKGSSRILVEGNIVHTCNHVHIYINRSIDPIVRNNLIYHLYTEDHLGTNGRPPAAIIFGDERAGGAPWAPSSGGQIYNNIVVGLGKLFMVRNNAQNYDTQLDGAYIGFNTFIGGSLTEAGIQISANLNGRPHRNSIFENNIIINSPKISLVSGDISGLAFRNNLWSEQPHQAMRGPGDRIGNPDLVNALAAIDYTFPDPNTSIDPQNYQLTSHSTLAIAKASDGSQFNGLRPPTIQKDFFGANRDGQPDIGAHEFAGVVTGLTANFSIGPGQAGGQLPHTVDFTDKSVAQRPIVSRLWDFGDGETSNETNPSHTYSTAGSFDVSLTVTDDQGNNDTATQADLITVTEQPDTLIPDTFRRFVVTQTANQQLLAYGTQYPDMRCIVIWNDEPYHLLNFADIEDVVRGLSEPGTTDIFWIDPSDDDEPLLPEDDTAPIDLIGAVFERNRF